MKTWHVAIGLLVFIIGFGLITQEPNDPVTQLSDIDHNVPLEDIIFDDFDTATRFLRYTDATQDDIERLRDRIRPLCHGEIEACYAIEYESVDEANDWLRDNDLVVGFVTASGDTYAYPFKILNYHELVNETLDDQPLLISYCPLCNSAVIYSRILGEEVLVFGNTSALYQSDLVMYDTATDSFWMQVLGEGILGEHTGRRLDVLPTLILSWEQWRETHPESLILKRPSRGAPYHSNPFLGYDQVVNRGQFAFPVDEGVRADNRLQAGETVIVVVDGDEPDAFATAYPIALLGDAVTVDRLGEREIVILTLADELAGAVYDRQLADGTLVNLERVDGRWVDAITGSQFDMSGLALSGSLQGQRLIPIPFRYTFWFAAVACLPNIQVYTPPDSE